MKVSRLNARLLVLLLTLLSITTVARATQEDPDEPDDYDVKDRVVRISMITGEVSLRRRANQDWERARLNYPLVEGDTVSTDKDSRMEIQIDARNFVRLAPGSALRSFTRSGSAPPNATSALRVMSPLALGRLISACAITSGSALSSRSSSSTGRVTLAS